jgi:hypothetical protein
MTREQRKELAFSLLLFAVALSIGFGIGLVMRGMQ